MLFRTTVLLLLCLTISSCSRCAQSPPAPKEPAFPAGAPMADSIRFTYLVYLPPGSNGRQALRLSSQLVQTRYKALKIVETMPGSDTHWEAPLASAHLEDNVPKNYAPPDPHTLLYRGVGLSSQQQRRLQRSGQAIVLRFAHSKQYVWSSLRAATELAEQVARRFGGFIYDEETRQVFTPDSWRGKRITPWSGEVPTLSTQFTIDLYPVDEYGRAVTLGLAKVGLPDVVVQDIPHSSHDQAASLINIFTQTMAEGATVSASGTLKIDIRGLKSEAYRSSHLKSLKEHGLGAACLYLKPGQRDEGDPENRLVELSAQLYSGPDPQARQENLFYSLFGSEDVSHEVRHTEELLAESRRERTHLHALQQAFNAGLQPGEYIQVKAPFPKADGGNEWMWVEITGWSGKGITGTLQNDPVEVRNLHAGQVVSVNEDDVFDYIRYYQDKHTEGNTTAKILERLQSGEKKPPDHAEMPDCDSH